MWWCAAVRRTVRACYCRSIRQFWPRARICRWRNWCCGTGASRGGKTGSRVRCETWPCLIRRVGATGRTRHLCLGEDCAGAVAGGAVHGVAEACAAAWDISGDPLCDAHCGTDGAFGAPVGLALCQDELPARLAVLRDGLAGGKAADRCGLRCSLAGDSRHRMPMAGTRLSANPKSPLRGGRHRNLSDQISEKPCSRLYLAIFDTAFAQNRGNVQLSGALSGNQESLV